MDNKPEPNSQPNPVGSSATGDAAKKSTTVNNTTTAATAPEAKPVAAKKPMPKGLLIGLIVGGVALIAVIIIVICCLLMGGEADYEATYNELQPLDTSMSNLTSGDCYKVNRNIDDSYTSLEAYQEDVDGCVTEFTAVETAMNKFAQTSGVKHDENIKKAFENFQNAFKAVYTSQDGIKSELNIYTAFHDFYLTIDDAGDDVKSLESAVNKAAQLFEDTKNDKLTTFAKGFRERGLAYVKAIENFQNSSSYSSALYDEVMDKMDAFVDYIDQEAPETEEITKFNATNMNNLDDAYSDLEKAVRRAYYDSL